jgi:hypothetical protein
VQPLKLFKDLLIHKATIQVDYDGDLRVIGTSNSLDSTPDHTLNTLPEIAVFFSGPEGTVRQKTLPGQLQGIKTFDFFICGIVVHDHVIDIQDDNIRLGDAKTPDEHGQMDFSEAQDKWPRECVQESFDCMRRDHISMFGLNQSSICLIIPQLVKIGQVAACTIQKVANGLLEKLLHRSSLFALPQACEHRNEHQLHNVDVFQVLHEEVQTSPTCYLFICRLNPIDFMLFFGLVFATLAHPTLHFLGAFFGTAFAVNKAIYTKKLQKCGGFFMH